MHLSTSKMVRIEKKREKKMLYYNINILLIIYFRSKKYKKWNMIGEYGPGSFENFKRVRFSKKRPLKVEKLEAP